uniref:Uncharacterized protein n=1 Tax=Anguilla anguilla TaxID=7936 RepID=A0A0E9S260_ANGAN
MTNSDSQIMHVACCIHTCFKLILACENIFFKM